MRNLDAGDEPEVNPSLPQTRRQHRFPRPCGLLDLDGGCAGSDGNPITSAETKRWNPCTATTGWEAEDKAVLPDPGLPYGITHSGSSGIAATAEPSPSQPAGTAFAATAEPSPTQPAGTAFAATAEPWPSQPAGTAFAEPTPARNAEEQAWSRGTATKSTTTTTRTKRNLIGKVTTIPPKPGPRDPWGPRNPQQRQSQPEPRDP